MGSKTKTAKKSKKLTGWRTHEPAWIITGIGVGLQLLIWLITYASAESRDPNIGLGLLMIAAIGITLFGLLVFAVVLERLKKLIPFSVAVIYVGGLIALWVAGENRANAIYYAEQQLRRVQQFEGDVAATSNSCAADAGYCTATIAGKEVITGCGLTLDENDICPPEDQSIDFAVGEQVIVAAMKAGRGDLYTLNCTGCSIQEK